MKLRTILAAATCLAMPVMAHAQPVTGPYVDLMGGGTILNPVNYKFQNTGDTGRYQYRLGYTAMGGIGYGFGDGFRVEIDGDYLHNTVHKIDDSSGVQGRTSGTEQNYGGFINGFYDASIPNFPLSPFVGGGVGYQQVQYSNSIGAYDLTTGRSGYVFQKKWSFAYDAIVGVSYPLPMIPGLSLVAEYRFMQLVQSRNFSTDGLGRIKMGQESSHSFLVGVRYQLFNPPPAPPAPAPAPAPVAAPAPAPAKTYLVFFDWDKYNLTPRALNIISQAAADSKTAQTTTIEVSGYTDTSGTPHYNLGLSWRRAKAVASQLVADGVPASEITTHGYGETHLLVPTGPGVREPQNRRVEIVLQ
jgi:OOP family OmpA-OmpF porin